MTTAKWNYTDAELRTLYRDAANRGAQIKIIAELEAKTVPDVVEKLESLGERVGEDTLASWGDRKKKRMLELLASGKTQKEVAKIMGVSRGTILRHKTLLEEQEQKRG